MSEASEGGRAPELPCSPGYRRCPQCAEEIPANAVKCPQCGDYLDGRPPPFEGAPSWLDEQFIKTSIPVIVIVSFLVSCFALPMALVGMIGCRHPEARKKALIMLLICGGIMALAVLSALGRQ